MEIKEVTVFHDNKEYKMFDFVYNAMINCKGEKNK